MTWEVRPCRQYAKSTDHPSWRVQRWCQVGYEGAYEMAFVHSDERLCEIIAQILNSRDQLQVWFYHNAEGIQIRIPITPDPS